MLIIALIIILVLVLIIKGGPTMFFDSGFEEEDEVITTVTTEEVSPNIVRFLDRQIENTQAFVIDPVDKMKIWLNSNDDLYEDAEGKFWRLK